MIDNDEEAVENKQQAKKLLDDYFKKQTKEKVSKISETKKKPRETSNDRSVKVSQTTFI